MLHTQIKGMALLEVMTSVSIIGILTAIALIDWSLLIERQQIKTAMFTVKNAIQQAQLSAIVQRENKKLEIVQQSLWIQSSPKATKTLLFDKVEENIELVMKGQLIFSPAGFSRAGSILISSPNYSTKIIVNSIGAIRHEDITLINNE